jgi:hypothetical protein
MTTLRISLAESLKNQLAARAAENGFSSTRAYIEHLLRADAGEAQIIDSDIEALLLQRLKSGPGIPFTPKFAAEFKEQIARERRSRRKHL